MKIFGGVVGTLVGTFLLGVAGYLLGLLFLAWFGPESCCGLEGLLPGIVGTVTGGSLGLVVGAMTGVLVARRTPLHLPWLLAMVVGGVALTWLGSLVLGPADIETIPNVLVFLTVTLFAPVIIWITGAWEKPDISI